MWIRISASAVANAAMLFFASPSFSQDVRSLSRQEAEAVMADQADETQPAGDCLRTPSGACQMSPDGTREFRLSRPPSGSSSPAVNTTNYNAPDKFRPTNRYKASSARRDIGNNTQTRLSRPQEVPLQFRLGSTELSAQSRVNLQTLATVLNDPANVGKRIQIIGHTDRSGRAEANLRLSKHRAEAVANFLAQQGVDRSRLDAQGRGSETPLENVSAFDPRNRRVEIQRIR